jgi:hypothetical protein
MKIILKLNGGYFMKINTGVKAGAIWNQHNEKQIRDDKSKDLKALKSKLRLNKETIRELRDSDLKKVVGGLAPPPETADCDTEDC